MRRLTFVFSKVLLKKTRHSLNEATSHYHHIDIVCNWNKITTTESGDISLHCRRFIFRVVASSLPRSVFYNCSISHRTTRCDRPYSHVSERYNHVFRWHSIMEFHIYLRKKRLSLLRYIIYIGYVIYERTDWGHRIFAFF